MSLTPSVVNTPRSLGAEQVEAVAPRPFLVPDDVALALDVAADLQGLGLEGAAVGVAGQRLQVEDLVALAEIVAPELDRGELLLRAGHAAHRQRTFGIEEIAVLPARFDANALAGAVAELAGDRAQRRRLEVDGEVDGPSVGGRDHPHLRRRDQPGGDQRAAEIVDLRAPELLARVKPGDQRHMPRR